MDEIPQHELYNRAKKKVKRKKAFINQIFQYIGTMIVLVFINTWFTPYYFWAKWPIIFWGLGLVIQGFQLATENFSDGWEEEALRKEIRKLKQKNGDHLELEDEYLELEDMKELRKDWKDSDLV